VIRSAAGLHLLELETRVLAGILRKLPKIIQRCTHPDDLLIVRAHRRVYIRTDITATHAPGLRNRDVRADETTDLGEDTGTSVSDDYAPGASSFNGKVKWVQIDIAEAAENADHLISPEERLRIAIARQ
jgi:hypothetical protein